jgi:gluconolactonase
MLRRVAETDAHEGPVFVAEEDTLYVTSVRREEVALRRVDLASGAVTTLLERTGMANGMTLAPDGALLVCEQGTRERPARISRVDRRTGASEPVVDGVGGLPLNSPNDLALHPRDGSLWFTDPSYGWLQGFRPRPQQPDRVYRCDPATGAVTVALDGLDKPNGIAFSPAGDVLYVSDNGAPKALLAFDVGPGGALSGRRVLMTTAGDHPDGVKTDAAGRVYASTPEGVAVLAPDGTPLGAIALPGAVTFAFGRDELLITTDTAVWAAVPPTTEGPHPWPTSAPAASSTPKAPPASSPPPSGTPARAAAAS